MRTVLSLLMLLLCLPVGAGAASQIAATFTYAGTDWDGWILEQDSPADFVEVARSTKDTVRVTVPITPGRHCWRARAVNTAGLGTATEPQCLDVPMDIHVPAGVGTLVIELSRIP